MDPFDVNFGAFANPIKLDTVDVPTLMIEETEEIGSETESTKCGEILAGSHGNFILVCVLCTENFRTLHSFGLHINSQHIKNQVDSNSAHLSPLRVDTVNVSEVEDELLSPVPNNEQQIEITLSPVSEDQVPQIVKCGDDCGQDFGYITERHNEGLKSDYNPQSRMAVEPKMTSTEVDQRQPRPFPTLTMTCIYCDKVFIDNATFGEHLSMHTGPKKYVCPHCPKTFDRQGNRRSHIRTHTGERPEKCSYCPKTFAERGNLVMHERTHLGIKKFSCDYCDRRFVQATEKKVHERTHTGEKPYQCEECGKQFVAQVKLTEHTKRHKNIRDYKCQHCDKAFFDSDGLSHHMPVHTKERPFNCKVCGQNFPRQRALRTHMELHSTVKKYICLVCGKAFRQFAGLYSHKKSHKNTPV